MYVKCSLDNFFINEFIGFQIIRNYFLVELVRVGDVLNVFFIVFDFDLERVDEMIIYIVIVFIFFCEIFKDVLKKIKGILINCYSLY